MKGKVRQLEHLFLSNAVLCFALPCLAVSPPDRFSWVPNLACSNLTDMV